MRIDRIGALAGRWLPVALAGAFALASLAGCGTSVGGTKTHGLSLYTPDDDSGTYDFFIEELELEGQRKDVQASSDDNTLVTGVAGDREALGYFGFAFYTEYADRLRAVPIQEGPDAEPVFPSLETILSGEYAPLSRPLFIYAKNSALARPEVADFLTYYLENVAALARAAGYVPPTEEEIAENLGALAEIKRAQSHRMVAASKIPVVVDGSSTVFPISAAAQEAYDEATPGINRIIVDLHGTGGGFGRYIEGEVDIIDASRPAKEDEERRALEKGLDWTRFIVGHDGITVVVHPSNDFVDKLTVEQLRRIFHPDSPVRTWKDINPAWPGEATGGATAAAAE